MRRLFSILSLVLICNLSIAQDRFSTGPTAGFNFAKFRTQDAEGSSATARPFMGVYGQFHPRDPLSIEINSSFSMRGEREDKRTLRTEGNFIDANLLLRFNFLRSFSFASGIGYYRVLNARMVGSFGSENRYKLSLNNVSELSQAVIPMELGFKFQNEATLHFQYGYALRGGFHNPGLIFRFPIRFSSNRVEAPSKRKKAETDIENLYGGLLLVRLPTAQPLIDALERRENSAKAAEIREAVEIGNRQIVSAFQSNYTFSNVYFFYSNSSRAIKEGDFSSLMNYDFQPVELARKDSLAPYYIAEFTNLKQDTGRYYIGSVIEPNPNGGVHRVKRYGNSNNSADYRVLVIKDRNFVQLKKPFPYAVRSFEKSFRESPEELLFIFPLLPTLNLNHDVAVEKLDKRLRRFFRRTVD